MLAGHDSAPGRPAVTPYRIALLGLGSVGRAVAERLLDDREFLAARAGGRSLELSAVAVRDPARLEGLRLPAETLVAPDPASLASSYDVDAVVELMGGLAPAGDLIRRALEGGVAVVTGNKAVLAERGAELEAVARASGSALRFEASVAGGTPVLTVLAEDLATMHVERIRGVINGTTNWILDLIEHEGMSAEEALAAARDAGYTEADPRLDTEGHDAAQKLVILGRLAFGRWIDPDSVQRVATEPPGAGGAGITKVTDEEVRWASEHGKRVRLVAEVAAVDGRIEAQVLPRFLERDDPLAEAKGITNILEIEGPPQGRIAISGPGAGGPAAAAVVLSDLVRLARGDGSTWAGLPAAE
jgi:homoserine dehydrogenase